MDSLPCAFVESVVTLPQDVTQFSLLSPYWASIAKEQSSKRRNFHILVRFCDDATTWKCTLYRRNAWGPLQHHDMKEFMAMKKDMRILEFSFDQCSADFFEEVDSREYSQSEIFDLLRELLKWSPAVEELRLPKFDDLDDAVICRLIDLFHGRFSLKSLTIPYSSKSICFVLSQSSNGLLQDVTICGNKWPKVYKLTLLDWMLNSSIRGVKILSQTGLSFDMKDLRKLIRRLGRSDVNRSAQATFRCTMEDLENLDQEHTAEPAISEDNSDFRSTWAWKRENERLVTVETLHWVGGTNSSRKLELICYNRS